jgi:hypothetical protein
MHYDNPKLRPQDSVVYGRLKRIVSLIRRATKPQRHVRNELNHVWLKSARAGHEMCLWEWVRWLTRWRAHIISGMFVIFVSSYRFCRRILAEEGSRTIAREVDLSGYFYFLLPESWNLLPFLVITFQRWAGWFLSYKFHVSIDAQVNLQY